MAIQNPAQINVRIDSAEYNNLRDISKKTGIPVSSLIRSALYRTYPEIRDE